MKQFRRLENDFVLPFNFSLISFVRAPLDIGHHSSRRTERTAI